MSSRIEEVAEQLTGILLDENQNGDVDRLRIAQVYCLNEEVGEFTGALRRFSGMARRKGDWADVEKELADVIITAYVTAYAFGIDIEAVIDAKLAEIYSRGWNEGEDSS